MRVFTINFTTVQILISLGWKSVFWVLFNNAKILHLKKRELWQFKVNLSSENSKCSFETSFLIAIVAYNFAFVF